MYDVDDIHTPKAARAPRWEMARDPRVVRLRAIARLANALATATHELHDHEIKMLTDISSSR